MGMIGHTQGVNKATKPPNTPMKNIHQSERIPPPLAFSPNVRISLIMGVHNSAFWVESTAAIGITKAESDFDKEYVNMMISGHKDAIDKFEKASTDAADSEIRSWAASMLTVLRQHLDDFIAFQNQLDKK